MALPILVVAIAFVAIFLKSFFLPNKSLPAGTTIPPGPKGKHRNFRSLVQTTIRLIDLTDFNLQYLSSLPPLQIT